MRPPAAGSGLKTRAETAPSLSRLPPFFSEPAVMKNLPLLLACLAICLISSLGSLVTAADPPPAGVPGRYTMQGQKETYLDLRPDGTYTMSIGGSKDSSTYTVKGTTVALVSPRGPIDLQVANGALTGPDGSKWPRAGEAGPAPAASDNVDPLSRLKSINQVKQLCIACRLWAGDHQGHFPDTLDQILTKEYAGTDPRLVRCPLLHDDSQVGYQYLGQGLQDSSPGEAIVLLSKWKSADGRQIVGHADGAVALEVPRAEDLPMAMRGAAPPPAPIATPSPNPKTTGPAPGAPNPPASSLLFTLSPNHGGKRYGAIFPQDQMPAEVDKFFWVVDRPDSHTTVNPMRLNTFFVSTLPGTYKVHVEYRAGDVKLKVSNVVAVTVPETATK